jgi:predicted dehydrogenase
MKKITVVVVGCGDRATVYCEEGVHHLNRLSIVACVDPDPERLSYMQEHFGVQPSACYASIEEVLRQGKIADCVINGTMDPLHKATSIPFLEQGYDMLLEKPIANNKKDLLAIKEAAEKNHCRLMICHVLRYAPFYRKVKELLVSGELGEIMNIMTTERVGAFHSSVSFLRGKWKSEKECGSSLLLQKCCHDIDLVCWLESPATPVSVYSDGGRNFFLPEKAPLGAGKRCLVDCPKEVREACLYDAKPMYLDNCLLPWYPWQCTGKNYQDVTMEEKVASLKGDNPHGGCVYKAGGDIVDHQSVMIRFSNGSLAEHTLVLGCMKAGRSLWLAGTRGEVEGNADEGILFLRKFDKKTSTYTETSFNFNDIHGETGGHFGGDKGLIQDFIALLSGEQPSLSCTSIEDSVTGHCLVYLADESLLRASSPCLSRRKRAWKRIGSSVFLSPS